MRVRSAVSSAQHSKLLIFALLLALGCPIPIAASEKRASRRAMIRALGSENPHPVMGDQARIFDRFIGTWDCDFGFLLDDGSVRHQSGELLFGWILDGRALQDIWVGYPAGQRNERTIGTSVRFFDTALKRWRVVFVSPQFNYLVTVQGGAEGDRIVLYGVDSDGSQIRWSFNEIESEKFTWRGERSRDGGKTWKLEEEHHMKRRSERRG